MLYQFGRKLGLAFQVQDDYLDAFGNPEKFGKQIGGDILADKKTFLLIHAFESASAKDKLLLESWMGKQGAQKIEEILSVYKRCGIDQWALSLKNRFFEEAISDLEQIAVLSARKKPLIELAEYLIQRDV